MYFVFILYVASEASTKKIPSTLIEHSFPFLITNLWALSTFHFFFFRHLRHMAKNVPQKCYFTYRSKIDGIMVRLLDQEAFSKRLMNVVTSIPPVSVEIGSLVLEKHFNFANSSLPQQAYKFSPYRRTLRSETIFDN